MSKFLSIAYWFKVNPEPLTPLAWQILLVLCGLLLIMTAATAFLKVRPVSYRGRLKKLYGFFLTNTALGLLLMFFNYEAAPFLSARFWLAGWGLLMIIWLFFVIRQLRRLPKINPNANPEEEIKKYLPH